MADPPDPELKILDGRFEIGGLLGRGGMAEVFRAKDLRHGRDVAVKILRGDVLDAIGVERFRREIAVTSAFTHPHILTLLESGETLGPDGKKLLYYVMPLVDGETIRERLAREDHLSLQESVRITREVLEALRYAHDHGVIHRDIKPANVLLSDGHAVVADFGIARPVLQRSGDDDDSIAITVSGIALGTPAYMAPEQAFGGKDVDLRCDLYAAGCVLYEMLIGRAPFDATTGQAVMSRKMTGAFVPASQMRPGLPPQIDSIVHRALQPDPSDRFASAGDFLKALDAIDDQMVSGSVRIGRAAVSRARRRTIASALAAIAAAALIAWLVVRPGAGLANAITDPSLVAVLPFELLEPDSSLAYIANGMTTDLTDALARVHALTVVTKNEVLSMNTKGVGLDSIERALKVGSLITGVVRRSGDRVRVSVRLIDGHSMQQFASHDAIGAELDLRERDSSTVDELTRFLLERVGEQVRIAKELRLVRSPDAWKLVEYVRSLKDGELALTDELTRKARAQRFQHADSLLVRASVMDSKWPEPFVQMASLDIIRALVEERSTPTKLAGDTLSGRDLARTIWSDAVRHADAALNRNAEYSPALRARGRARMELWRTSIDASSDSLRSLAESDLRAAVDHNPEYSGALYDLSSLLSLAGDFAESQQAAAEAWRVDPYLQNAPAVLARLQFASLGAGQAADAARWCQKGQTLYPNEPRFVGCELTTLGWTGDKPTDVKRAWTILHESELVYKPDVKMSGWATRRFFVAAIAARAGLRDSAQKIISRVRADTLVGVAKTIAAYSEAQVRALLGQPDSALVLLGVYLKSFPIQRRQVARLPLFKSLRADPRFIAMTATR